MLRGDNSEPEPLRVRAATPVGGSAGHDTVSHSRTRSQSQFRDLARCKLLRAKSIGQLRMPFIGGTHRRGLGGSAVEVDRARTSLRCSWWPAAIWISVWTSFDSICAASAVDSPALYLLLLLSLLTCKPNHISRAQRDECCGIMACQVSEPVQSRGQRIDLGQRQMTNPWTCPCPCPCPWHLARHRNRGCVPFKRP